jgi:hypothetical protein
VEKVNDIATIIVIGNKSDMSVAKKIDKNLIDKVLSSFNRIIYVETNIFDDSVKLLETELENIANNMEKSLKSSTVPNINMITSKNNDYGYTHMAKNIGSIMSYCRI